MESTFLYGFSLLRSGIFAAESLMIPVADALATRQLPDLPFTDWRLFLRVRAALRALLRKDAERIAEGYFPAGVLLASEPVAHTWDHLVRLPRLWSEALRLSKRRQQRVTRSFSPEAEAAFAEDLPDYYVRNFHFQQDGYLSRESAELYEHQVELLFAGAADPMRRLAIPPLKDHFGMITGRGLRFLELGCGLGSSTCFLKLAFPQAEIVAVDLSKAYLDEARSRHGDERTIFMKANAEELPFADGEFDAVVSVFLFHELPLDARERVLRESRRVLKKTGLMVAVDSLQLGDQPELDAALRLFPKRFHEPFYPNYLRHPLTELVARHGFGDARCDQGFFSKVCAAQPTALPARRAPRAQKAVSRLPKGARIPKKTARARKERVLH